MNTLKTILGGLAFSSCLITSCLALANNTSTGAITFRDKDNDSCSLNAPPTGSGFTWQYELRAGQTACKDNTADSVAFSDLPSATTIILTDNEDCSKKASKDNTFWFELKTIKKLTNTEIIQMSHLADYNEKTIIQPGLQLIGKGRYNEDGSIREKLSCVRITVSSPEIIPKEDPIVILPDAEWSDAVPENKSDFTCSGDKILIGRKHVGDEKGDTQYHCGTLNSTHPFTLTQRQEHIIEKEADSYYLCPPTKVLTGRKHFDDENGPTTYRCATVIDSQGHTVNQIRGEWSEPVRESMSLTECATNEVMVGRQHEHDENGDTRIRCAKLTRTVTAP
jgi:hypothetical protein